MSEWRALCEVAETNPESLSGATNRDYLFKYIDLSAVQHGQIEWNAIQETRFIDAPSRARRVVRLGDVLFGTVRPALQSHGCIDQQNQTDLIASTGFSVIRAIEGKADPHYLRHYVLSTTVLRQALNAAVGSNYPAVNDSDVQQFRIFAPALAEQSAIARILDTLDTQIEKTQAIIAKLEHVKEGLLHDLLTRGVDEKGELRPSAEEAPELYRESELGLIPRGWALQSLEDVAPLDRSVLRTGPFGSSLKGEHWREIGRPVITIGSLANNRFIHTELLFVDEQTAAALADFTLRPGDIVFSRVADVGRSVVVTEAENQWIMSSNFIRISVNGQIMRPRFLQLLLASSTTVRSQLRATVNSAGRDVVNSGILMQLRFLTPPLEEQDEIIEKVVTVENRLTRESNALLKLNAEKSGLMDDLLTGRVRVPLFLADLNT